jgi:hypothetical protein
MSTYVVLVIGRELHELEAAYGPYRSKDRALALVALLTDPFAADYRASDEYEVYATRLAKYSD